MITKEKVFEALNGFMKDMGFEKLKGNDILSNAPLDSLDQVELVMHIEGEFGIDLDDEKIDVNPREWTVDQWCEWVVEQAKAQT